MKKKISLTEDDLTKIVKKVLMEQGEFKPGIPKNDYGLVSQILSRFGFTCSSNDEKYKGQLICDGQTSAGGKRAQVNVDGKTISIGVSGVGRSKVPYSNDKDNIQSAIISNLMNIISQC